MFFALIGIGIVAPFALAIAMILSMESQRENQMRQIRAIADDWQKYLNNFDTGSSDVRHDVALDLFCRGYATWPTRANPQLFLWEG